MSETKFKGYQPEMRKWVYGNLIKIPNGGTWIFDYKLNFEDSRDKRNYIIVDEDSVGQFILLEDKYKTELYSGDIVKLHDKWEDESTPYSTYEIILVSPLSVKFVALTQSTQNKKTHGNIIGTDTKLGDWVYEYLIKIGTIYENI